MPDDKPDIDTSKKFKRAGSSVTGLRGRFTRQLELHVLAQLGYGLDPRSVPVSVLQLMGATCPAVYLAERTVSGIVRRSDLFSVRHGDPKIIAETEAWLWPRLPRLLGGAARGYGYGTVVCVLDWERKTMRVEVPSADGKTRNKTRNKTLVDHTHFAAAFEVHPDATSFRLDEQGEIAAVDVLGTSYPASRVAPWIWDPEFGEVLGQGARQRAWRAYCQYLIVSLLRDKYLERSVDAPRIAYTPSGKVGGSEVEIPDHVLQLLLDLQGSGGIALPSVRDSHGERKYDVQAFNLPDRARVWDDALDRAEAEVFKAYLVPPGMAGAVDGEGATKALEGMLREFIEDLAGFAAQGLTRLVHLVHAANYDPEKVAPPDVIATDVGKVAARKTYLEVLRLANSAAGGEISARADLPKLLDLLGIPVREKPEEEEDEDVAGDDEKSGEEPGRPRDPFGDREQRREDATTSEGEDDTGGDDVEREERA